MSKFNEAIEEVAKPKPNAAMQGAVHAKTPGFNPFPTINMNLNRANVTLDFKYDAENKKYYSIVTDLWDPVHEGTYRKYKGRIINNMVKGDPCQVFNDYT